MCSDSKFTLPGLGLGLGFGLVLRLVLGLGLGLMLGLGLGSGYILWIKASCPSFEIVTAVHDLVS